MKRKSGETVEQLALINETGTVLEFMDVYVVLHKAYVPHRFTLIQSHRSDTEFEHNCMPGHLLIDIDWAQNMISKARISPQT